MNMTVDIRATDGPVGWIDEVQQNAKEEEGAGRINCHRSGSQFGRPSVRQSVNQPVRRDDEEEEYREWMWP